MAGTHGKRVKDQVLRTAGISQRSNVRIERDYNSVKPHITAYAQSLASMLLGIPDAGAVRIHVKDAGEVISALSKLPPISGDTVLTQTTYLGLLPDIAVLTVVYTWPHSWMHAHQGIMDSLKITGTPVAQVNLNREAPSVAALEEKGCTVAHGDTHLPLITYRVRTTVSSRPIGATIRLVHVVDDVRDLLTSRAGEALGASTLQPVLLSIDRAAERLARIASILSTDPGRADAPVDPARSLELLESEINGLQTSPESRARLLGLVGAVRGGLPALEKLTDVWSDDLPDYNERRPQSAPSAAPAPPPPAPEKVVDSAPPPPAPAPATEEPAPQPPEPPPVVTRKSPSNDDTLIFRRSGEPGIIDTLELIRKALDEVQTEQPKAKS